MISLEEKFIKKLHDMAIAKHDELHWSYQMMMQDHVGNKFPDFVRQGQVVPPDINGSAVHQLVEQCHILLCVSTFKRSFQLKESLALNIAQTWE